MRSSSYNRLLILSLCLGLHTAACKDIGSTTTAPVLFTLGQQTSISFGGTIFNRTHEVSVTFSEVNDSRCPDSPNIRCVWEGDAQVGLMIIRGTDRKLVELHTHDMFAREVKVHGYRIRLIQVSPYPEDVVIPDDDYVALVEIEKL